MKLSNACGTGKTLVSTVRLRAMFNLGVGAGLLICAATSTYATDEQKIGFAVARSGWMEAYDTGATQAALIAIDDINAKGGLLGKKLVADIRDTRTDLARSAQVAQELIAEDLPMMVVSCDYDMGAPAALANESAGKISTFLCAGDFKAGVHGIGPHAFSAASEAHADGAAMAEWAYNKRNVRNVYLLLDTSIQYDRSMCGGFEWMFKQMDGVKVIGKETFENNDTSIASQITRIKSLPTAPDAIMLCSYLPGAASAVRQIRAAGIKAPLLNGTSMDGDYWLSSVPGLDNFFAMARASVRGDDPRPAVNDLVTRYKAKFGSAPVSQASLDGYAAIQNWAIGVEQAGTFDPDAVVAAMEKFNAQETLLGPRSFTSTMHIQTRMPMLITETSGGSSKVIDQVTLSRDIPESVLLQQ
ncbi:ABC transporter substrate-binding protein [Pseudomonas sp. NPDC088444]|uniref:ABC transporter substrate-binding protein n=1 Tax=Pseudomonas sp. NPDC088444 TaxID=3364456 RepID=UPI00384D19D1